LILKFDTQVCGLLRYAVKAVNGTTDQRDDQEDKESDGSLFYTDAADD